MIRSLVISKYKPKISFVFLYNFENSIYFILFILINRLPSGKCRNYNRIEEQNLKVYKIVF